MSTSSIDRQVGRVKWFDNSRGFGFIEPTEGGRDIFVHYSAIEANDGEFRTLTEGEEVEFDLTQGGKGPQADNVVKL